MGEGGETVEGCVGFLMGGFADAVGQHGGVEGGVGRGGEVICVSETGAPVAEIGGDDKYVAGVGDVGG